MAGVKIYIATAKIWDHFFENFNRLAENEDCIAENPDNGMSLYLTASTVFPELILYGSNNRPIIWRPVRTKEECSAAAVYMITKYVDEEQEPEKPKIIELPMSKNTAEVIPVEIPDDTVEPDEDELEQKMLDEIYEREDELEKAVGDCLATILIEEDYNAVKEGYGNLINEVVDDLLEYLYNNHQISVYRPTILTDEATGEEIFAEFPYGYDEEYETMK